MDVEILKEQFNEISPLLLAIGDETRQHIILKMLELPCECEGGVRVGDITAKTNLSRPAISHHLKILKDAGVVGMRKQGTMNFYFLKAEQNELNNLQSMLVNLIEMTKIHNKK